MGVTDGWVEIGDRVFVRRYAFYDQNIGVVLGSGEALVIDTRSTYPQAREILADLSTLTAFPVTVVVDTHGHFDHAFGNRIFWTELVVLDLNHCDACTFSRSMVISPAPV